MTGHTFKFLEVREFRDSIGVCNPDIKNNYKSRIAEVVYWGKKGRPEAVGYAHLFAAAPELLKALTAEAKSCPDCGGTGIAYLMADETEVGQPPGSSGVDCGGCALSRAAIAKATGEAS